MARNLVCEWCSGNFEALRSDARFCRPGHRTAASRKRRRDAETAPNGSPQAETPVSPAAEPPTSVHEATLAELRGAGKDATASGLALLALAHRIDHFSAVEPGSSLASVVRTFSNRLDALLADAHDGAGDALDELARKREARRATNN